MVQNSLRQDNQISISTAPKSIEHSCPNCSHLELSVFYEVRNVPVHSCLMMSNKQEASNFPCGDVVLGFCNNCGFITNTEFDSKWSAYAPNYEDQQSFSPTFNKFAHSLANKLIDKYDLHHKNIVEIGCSKGDFLLMLCELGNNRGVGIDPSVVPNRVQSDASDRVTFIRDYYSQKHSKYVGDFICCRHTLEHIQPTAEFIKTVRSSIGDRHEVNVVFEIPNNTKVLQDLAFEDIYYEHCSYFSPGTLARLFRNCGFEVKDLYCDYGDQYLIIEAQPTDTPSATIHPEEETVSQVADDVRHFTENITDKLNYWKDYLTAAQQKQEKVVVWGSGSKCVSFLTTLNTVDKIEYAVDINPHRHGKFIPGVGKEIMPPEFLKTYRPDRVIIMNSIYRDEISKMLREMGVATEVVSL
ncbi:class I SAM-dependent methyltransferase [Myxosarcina sp. GI1]|uniref:class I SAM-dependent methyltransferase n=1 Tax=Myxosarcina sp. GI1 TaxID=1541065 RepID=UPI00068ADC2D|nr:class I SAM-dependent methyltransferase [Myxosarcina sp. GI1]